MTKYKTIEDFKNQIPEGATHYTNETSKDHFAFFKFVDGKVEISIPFRNKSWVTSDYDRLDEIKNLVALTPEKEPKFKHVPVEDSIFDLKAEFEAGKLFYDCNGEFSGVIDSEGLLMDCILDGKAYRRIEQTEEDELFEVLTNLDESWFEVESANYKTYPEYLAKSGKLKLA